MLIGAAVILAVAATVAASQRAATDPAEADGPRLFSTGLLAGLYIAVLVNLNWPGVRFTTGSRNYAVFMAAQFIPLAILLTGTWQIGWRRSAAFGIGFLLLVPACPLGLGAAACVAFSIPDDASMRLHVVANEAGRVAVYRTNGGALDADGIEVSQECDIVPGLIVVRRLANAYPAFDAFVEMHTSGVVTIVIPPSEERLEELRQQVRLRRFCWGPER
jgi:hypothetical protein